MGTSGGSSRALGVVATTVVGAAAVLSVVVGLVARQLWSARIEVEFTLFAPFVIAMWLAAGGLFLHWLRATAAATGRPQPTWLVALWILLVLAALGTAVGYLAFMDFGRPTYRPRSEVSVTLNLVAITVTGVAATALALVVLLRTRRTTTSAMSTAPPT